VFLNAYVINWLQRSSDLYARQQVLLWCILAIAILSVCLSVTRVDQLKTVQARITKSSPSAAWKTSFRISRAFP